MLVHAILRTIPILATALLTIGAAFVPAARAQCPAAAPQNATISNGHCNVVITWLAPPGGGAIQYYVYRGSTPNFSAASLIGATVLLSYVDQPEVGEICHYWVRSVPNPLACGQPGGLASAGSVAAGTVNAPTVTPQACTGLSVSWSLLRGATSYRIDRHVMNSLGELVLDRTITSTAIAPPVFDVEAIRGVAYRYIVYGLSACTGGAAGYFSGAVQFPQLPQVSAVGEVAQPGDSTATLRATPSNASVAVAYRWYRNGTPLSGPKYSGTESPELVIHAPSLDDEGTYYVRLFSDCGQPVASAVLAIVQPCRADFNASGQVSVQDVFDFLAAYFAGCP